MSSAAVAPASGQVLGLSLQEWSGKLLAVACNRSSSSKLLTSQLAPYSGVGCDVLVGNSELALANLTTTLQNGDCEKVYEELATLDLQPSSGDKAVKVQLQAWFVQSMAAHVEASLASGEKPSSEILNSVGGLLICKAEDYTRAGKLLVACVKEAPEVDEKVRANQQIALCFVQLTNLGASHLEAGRLTEAQRCFEEARALLETVSSGTMQTREFAQLLTNLGTVYGKLGKVEVQQAMFQEAKAKYEALGCTEHPQYQVLLRSIAAAKASGKSRGKCKCTIM